MHRSKNSFLEWLVYSLIFFFLYDIIWILVDLPDFLQSISGLYPELLVDFALCGLFSLSSLYLNRWLFRQRRFWREGQGHHDLEQALDPARFFRLNRQYIANIKGIRKISLYFGSKLMVKLKGCEDDNIVISKEKATLFKKWLEK